MNVPDRNDPRAVFDYLSTEYAQATHAFAAIEKQAATLMAFGGSDELRTFIEQFLDMATTARTRAEELGEPNFAEWFGELVEKAEALRHALSGAR